MKMMMKRKRMYYETIVLLYFFCFNVYSFNWNSKLIIPTRLRSISISCTLLHSSHHENNSDNSNNNNNSFHKLNKARHVEYRMNKAIEQMQILLNSYERTKRSTSLSSSSTLSFNKTTSSNIQFILFPNVRDINSALATLGDEYGSLRALRLFFKMRKSLTLSNRIRNKQKASKALQAATNNNKNNKKSLSQNMKATNISLGLNSAPAPTLVTYSTLMSRAVSSGKAHVAIRYWNLMAAQNNYFTSTSISSTKDNVIVPDIRAVNILMNAFAKLADVSTCNAILRHISPQPAAYQQPFKQQEQQEQLHNTILQTLPSPSSFPSLSLKPNTVTYNTLLDACYRSGELEFALRILQEMKCEDDCQPDITSYTTLISTVGQQKKRRTRNSTTTSKDTSSSSLLLFGRKDPDIAFALFEEATNEMKLVPNGKTYTALIDVCKHCERSDLALKVLRMMLRNSDKKVTTTKRLKKKRKEDEWLVGAWTNAIDACVKAKRMDTAMRLFRAMVNANSVNTNRINTNNHHRNHRDSIPKPNLVTCGCLMNGLFKIISHQFQSQQQQYDILTTTKEGEEDYYTSNHNIKQLLEVLTYLEKEKLEPTEVMYTSLLSSAAMLLKMSSSSSSNSSAINIYTYLMNILIYNNRRNHNHENNEAKRSHPTSSVITSNNKQNSTTTSTIHNMKTTNKKERNEIITPPNSNTLLLKVFLVYQNMKTAGAIPDIATYNALLHACRNAGDLNRSFYVLLQIYNNNGGKVMKKEIKPTFTTWQEVLMCCYIHDSRQIHTETQSQSHHQQQEPSLELLEFLEVLQQQQQLDETIIQGIKDSANNSIQLMVYLWKLANNELHLTPDDKVTNKNDRKNVDKPKTSKSSSSSTSSLSLWKPNLKAFELLIMGHFNQAISSKKTKEEQIRIFHKIVQFYLKATSNSSVVETIGVSGEDDEYYKGMGLHLLDTYQIHQNPQIVMAVLRSFVVLELSSQQQQKKENKNELLDLHGQEGNKSHDNFKASRKNNKREIAIQLLSLSTFSLSIIYNNHTSLNNNNNRNYNNKKQKLLLQGYNNYFSKDEHEKNMIALRLAMKWKNEDEEEKKEKIGQNNEESELLHE